jgi:hypothetical protein
MFARMGPTPLKVAAVVAFVLVAGVEEVPESDATQARPTVWNDAGQESLVWRVERHQA